jgi:hypothetical protein
MRLLPTAVFEAVLDDDGQQAGVLTAMRADSGAAHMGGLQVSLFSQHGEVLICVQLMRTPRESKHSTMAWVRGGAHRVCAMQPSLWLAFRYGEHGTATLVDFTSQRQQRLERERQEAQQRDAYGEVTPQTILQPKGLLGSGLRSHPRPLIGPVDPCRRLHCARCCPSSTRLSWCRRILWRRTERT